MKVDENDNQQQHGMSHRTACTDINSRKLNYVVCCKPPPTLFASKVGSNLAYSTNTNLIQVIKPIFVISTSRLCPQLARIALDEISRIVNLEFKVCCIFLRQIFFTPHRCSSAATTVVKLLIYLLAQPCNDTMC